MPRTPRHCVPLAFGLLLGCGLLGCGGGAKPDRGLESGSGEVDGAAGNPTAGMNAARDWPMWRGADGTGVSSNQSLPATFGEKKNVVWKAKLPGRGHSSPTLYGDRIYLATADEAKQTQSVLALDRATGDRVWTKQLHSGGFPPTGEMHPKSSHASCTLACDGERLFVAFLNHDAIHVTALDLEGNVVWQKEAGDFDSKFGYAPSPTLYKTSVIVAADHQGGGHVTSWDRETGELNWRIKRPAVSTYASPIVHEIDGKDHLLIAGARRITSYDPVSGEENWSAEGVAEACVGTVVVNGNVVVASGGYPEDEILAVDATSGNVLWRERHKSYVPSLVAHEGHVYMLNDDGNARCFDATTGEETWEPQRLGQSGKVSASPLLADGRLFTISEGGDLVVLAADPENFEILQKVAIEDEAFASPVACGNRLYLRVTAKDGRQEWLYCFGE